MCEGAHTQEVLTSPSLPICNKMGLGVSDDQVLLFKVNGGEL